MKFHFDVVNKDTRSNARTGIISTAHGKIHTPAFMAVGTQGTVKALTPDMLRDLGAEIVLSNTYHLYLRPGHERIAGAGGLHRFMNWPGPILTDSGGYQVFSLGALRKITEAGVMFQSHIDGSRHFLTPELAVDIQLALGTDIMMCLDECTPYPVSARDAEISLERTLRWARRCHTQRENSAAALFGIVQGGMYLDLRRKSLEGLMGLPFEGLALGGLSVGEPKEKMLSIVGEMTPQLPEDRPRYIMGVGTPADIVACVAAGADMFDCVMPTRNGRHGQAFTRFGKVNFRNARHADDPRPLDEASSCPAARDYSRAYLHHLVRTEEMLGSMLITWINLAYYQELMAGARAAIAAGRYADYMAEVREGWARGDIEAWKG